MTAVGLSVAKVAFGKVVSSNKRNVGPYVEDGVVDSIRSLIFNGATNNKKSECHLLLRLI
jgi:hypothetical protein